VRLVQFSVLLLWLVAPPPGADFDSFTSGWLRSLKVPGTGESCCGVADCRHFRVEWRNGGPAVEYGGVWLPIPDQAVIRGSDNPTGEDVTCVAPHWSGGIPDPRVLCYYPGLKA
jgi:hypothetical protein